MYADVDLGYGYGQPVVQCNISDETLTSMEGFFTFKAPAIFDLELPYYFRMEDQSIKTSLTPESYIRVVLTCAGQSITTRARLAYGKNFYRTKTTHRTQRTFTNDIVTYTAGTDLGEVHGVLTMRGLTRDDGKALWVFISQVLRLNLNKFNIEVFA